MLTGTLVTIAGFVPIGFAAELGRRIHLLDLRGGRHRAVASWFVAVVFAPLLGMALLSPPKTERRAGEARRA